jgi:hypothetical protein
LRSARAFVMRPPVPPMFKIPPGLVGAGVGFQDFEGGFAGQDECLNSVRLPHVNGMPIIWAKARIVMG